MDQEEQINAAKKVLKNVNYASIATVSSDGSPWNSPVRYLVDDQLNIYWFSNKNSQHSQNIRANGKAFIVIYSSETPEGQCKGVYMQATAKELETREEIVASRSLLDERMRRTPEDFSGNAIRRAYRAVPYRVWVNILERRDGYAVQDYRVELPLQSLQTTANIHML